MSLLRALWLSVRKSTLARVKRPNRNPIFFSKRIDSSNQSDITSLVLRSLRTFLRRRVAVWNGVYTGGRTADDRLYTSLQIVARLSKQTHDRNVTLGYSRTVVLVWSHAQYCVQHTVESVLFVKLISVCIVAVLFLQYLSVSSFAFFQRLMPPWLEW